MLIATLHGALYHRVDNMPNINSNRKLKKIRHVSRRGMRTQPDVLHLIADKNVKKKWDARNATNANQSHPTPMLMNHLPPAGTVCSKR